MVCSISYKNELYIYHILKNIVLLTGRTIKYTFIRITNFEL